MTDAAKARDEHLIAAIAVVLTSGFFVENARGDARLDREGDQFRVLTIERDPDNFIRPVNECFEDMHEAIRYYLDRCESC